MSKRECGAITPKVVVAVAVMREETHAKPLDLAESAEMLRKLLDSFKNDVVDLVLANAFPEAKAAAERVREEEKFIHGILLRLEQDYGLTREEVIAHLAKRYKNDPADRRTAWARLLDE
jgi:hypothetical protein